MSEIGRTNDERLADWVANNKTLVNERAAFQRSLPGIPAAKRVEMLCDVLENMFGAVDSSVYAKRIQADQFRDILQSLFATLDEPRKPI